MPLVRFPGSRRRTYLSGYSGAGSRLYHVHPKYPDEDGHGGPPCSNCYIFAEVIEEATKKDYIGERECNFYKQYFKDACGRDISDFRKNWDKHCKSKRGLAQTP